jgi:hypothetical protein
VNETEEEKVRREALEADLKATGELPPSGKLRRGDEKKRALKAAAAKGTAVKELEEAYTDAAAAAAEEEEGGGGGHEGSNPSSSGSSSSKPKKASSSGGRSNPKRSSYASGLVGKMHASQGTMVHSDMPASLRAWIAHRDRCEVGLSAS